MMGGVMGQRRGGGDVIHGSEAPEKPPQPPLPFPPQPPSPRFSINTLRSLVTLALIVCEACSLRSPLPQTIKSAINTLDCFHRVGALCIMLFFWSPGGCVRLRLTDRKTGFVYCLSPLKLLQSRTKEKAVRLNADVLSH